MRYLKPARTLRLALFLLLGLGAAATDVSAQAVPYSRATTGTRTFQSDNGLRIRILVESSNLGGSDADLGEITFPVGFGAGGQSHRHGSNEILYVLDGELDHIVNGETHRLTVGMVGIVRQGDSVIHRVVGQTPVRALVVWAPGGEVVRLIGMFPQRPSAP